MTEKIIIAGSGGQGIMLLGKVISGAALRKGLNVTWFPTYGAEVRGGSAYCMVIISSEDIPSPYVDKADTLIVMNEPSLFKFKQRVKNNGLLLANSSLIDSKNIKHKIRISRQYYLPFTETAMKLGNIKVTNMIALGAYIAKRRVLEKRSVFSSIEDIAPEGKKNLININKQAVEEGIGLVA